MEQKEKKLPFHRHFGLRLLQVLLVVLSLVLVKRYTDIYHDNKQVDRQTEIEYFEKGYASGMNKSMGLQEDPEPQFKNYALKKSYRDGYPKGRDKGREKRSSHKVFIKAGDKHEFKQVSDRYYYKSRFHFIFYDFAFSSC